VKFAWNFAGCFRVIPCEHSATNFFRKILKKIKMWDQNGNCSSTFSGTTHTTDYLFYFKKIHFLAKKKINL
jgi:hypothetical protein